MNIGGKEDECFIKWFFKFINVRKYVEKLNEIVQLLKEEVMSSTLE